MPEEAAELREMEKSLKIPDLIIHFVESNLELLPEDIQETILELLRGGNLSGISRAEGEIRRMIAKRRDLVHKQRKEAWETNSAHDFLQFVNVSVDGTMRLLECEIAIKEIAQWLRWRALENHRYKVDKY